RRASVAFGDDPPLLGILHRDFLPEEMPDAHFEPTDHGRQIKSFPDVQFVALDDHAPFNHSTTAVRTILANASGMNRRQPKSINWSYRNRGHIQRTQIIMNMTPTIFARKMPICAIPASTPVAGWSRPATGKVQPPRKSVTSMAEPVVMAAYSPI